ncbi:ankyrin repeat-containing domain protein [Podospora conica]|nr:ankyrin repeat-containing domain protein [Schizothecium conicum]
MASILDLPDELLLEVARHLGDLPPHHHRKALAALSLAGNHRLHDFFEPLLYNISSTEGHPCAMKWAAFYGNVAIMAKAKANGVDPHNTGGSTKALNFHKFDYIEDYYLYPFNPTALQIAVMQGHNACIDWMLQNGADINEETRSHASLAMIGMSSQEHKWRLLFWATRFNQPHVIQFLLARGSGLLLSSLMPKFRPLHLAAALGHVDLFDMLLEIPGCDIDDADGLGNTPLSYARQGIRRSLWGSSGFWDDCPSLLGIQDAVGSKEAHMVMGPSRHYLL